MYKKRMGDVVCFIRCLERRCTLKRKLQHGEPLQHMDIPRRQWGAAVPHHSAPNPGGELRFYRYRDSILVLAHPSGPMTDKQGWVTRE